MYAPGNSVVVNLLMRWPKLIPVAVCCAIATVVSPPEAPPAADEAPPAVVAPPPVVADPAPPVNELPALPPKKKIRG